MATAPTRMRNESVRKARERIDIRLRPEQNAQRTIREYEMWTLEQPDAELFAEALAQPPSLGPRLTAAAKSHKDRILQR
jgi:hypothetical protein